MCRLALLLCLLLLAMDDRPVALDAPTIAATDAMTWQTHVRQRHGRRERCLLIRHPGYFNVPYLRCRPWGALPGAPSPLRLPGEHGEWYTLG